MKRYDDFLDIDIEIKQQLPSTPELADLTEAKDDKMQMVYLAPNIVNNMWAQIRKGLNDIANARSLTAFQLQSHIEGILVLHYKTNISSKVNFQNLKIALDQFPQKERFLNGAIQAFAKLALRIETEFPDYIELVTDKMVLSSTKVSILIANMFFCCTHLQPNHKSFPRTFNFARLFHKSQSNELKVEKIKCFLHYIIYITQNDPRENIIFSRVKSTFILKEAPLCEFTYVEEASMFDCEEGELVDFANKFIGGGVLSNGCIQEEILFLIHPEAIVALLITPEIQNNEAIIIEGVQRLINHTGYGDKFQCLELQPQSRRTLIVIFIYDKCIDASYYEQNVKQQYKIDEMQREICKAMTGFFGHNNIITGKWGCGAFKGEWQLKALIQWISASIAGSQQITFINDESYMFNNIFQQLQSMTTTQLYQMLIAYIEIKQGEWANVDLFALDYVNFVLYTSNIQES